MSYDLQIQNKCDHLINWERTVLESDRYSFYLTYPVASTASLNVRINNVLVPQNSYSVVVRRQVLSVQAFSAVTMSSKIKLYQPLIEAQYTTYSSTCPKCLSVKTVDDFLVTSSGDYQTVEKEILLLQDLEKCIVTQLSSNPFHDWYGTGLQSLIGTKITDFQFIESRIVEEVNSAIEKLKNVQRDLVSSRRSVSPGELYGQTLDITVERATDPTLVFVTISFTSQSNQQLEYSQAVQLSTPRERVSFS